MGFQVVEPGKYQCILMIHTLKAHCDYLAPEAAAAFLQGWSYFSLKLHHYLTCSILCQVIQWRVTCSITILPIYYILPILDIYCAGKVRTNHGLGNKRLARLSLAYVEMDS